MASPNANLFSVATAVTEQEDRHHFIGQIDLRWSTAGVPSGGYLLAMLARAALVFSGKPHVIAVTSHFLSVAQFGAVSIDVMPLRLGKGGDQLRLIMSQGGVTRVDATVSTGTLSDSPKGRYWDGGRMERPSVAYGGCRRFTPAPSFYPSPLMSLLDLRLDTESLGFERGSPSGRGRLDGWMGLPEDEGFDTAALVFALDAPPPATFDIEPTAWVPTLTFTAYVRALPAPGPVQFHYKVGLICDERVDQGCTIWDSAGNWVAQSAQLASIRISSM